MRAWGRAILGLVGGCGWAAVLMLLHDQMRYAKVGLLGAIWQDLGFFTDLGNLAVAMTFTAVAGRVRWVGPRLIGQAVVAILVVGIGYWTVGRGYLVFGTLGWGDVLAHGIVPVLAPLAWIVAAPKARLGWGDPLRWLTFPAVYFVYAVTRGLATGHYAYGWLNGGMQGWVSVAIMVAIFFAMTLVLGLALIGIARLPGAVAR